MFVLFQTNASLAYSLIYNNNYICSIHNLEIQGYLYNVDFLYTTPDTYGANPDELIFWTSQEDAVIAANSILTILNYEGIDTLIRTSTGSHFIVTYDYGSRYSTSIYALEQNGLWSIQDEDYISSTGKTVTSWTVVQSVPIPNSLFLLGMGLIGSVGFLKKRN
jgi:hypothetical protein